MKPAARVRNDNPEFDTRVRHDDPASALAIAQLSMECACLITRATTSGPHLQSPFILRSKITVSNHLYPSPFHVAYRVHHTFQDVDRKVPGWRVASAHRRHDLQAKVTRVDGTNVILRNSRRENKQMTGPVAVSHVSCRIASVDGRGPAKRSSASIGERSYTFPLSGTARRAVSNVFFLRVRFATEIAPPLNTTDGDSLTASPFRKSSEAMVPFTSIWVTAALPIDSLNPDFLSWGKGGYSSSEWISQCKGTDHVITRVHAQMKAQRGVQEGVDEDGRVGSQDIGLESAIDRERQRHAGRWEPKKDSQLLDCIPLTTTRCGSNPAGMTTTTKRQKHPRSSRISSALDDEGPPSYFQLEPEPPEVRKALRFDDFAKMISDQMGYIRRGIARAPGGRGRMEQRLFFCESSVFKFMAVRQIVGHHTMIQSSWSSKEGKAASKPER
ncbi:hypothetical protein V8E55_003704 [Tylopilus felleus]